MPQNVKYLNHPKAIPPPPAGSMEKLSSKKPVPGAKKVGDHCSRNHHWTDSCLGNMANPTCSPATSRHASHHCVHWWWHQMPGSQGRICSATTSLLIIDAQLKGRVWMHAGIWEKSLFVYRWNWTVVISLATSRIFVPWDLRWCQAE